MLLAPAVSILSAEPYMPITPSILPERKLAAALPQGPAIYTKVKNVILFYDTDRHSECFPAGACPKKSAMNITMRFII